MTRLRFRARFGGFTPPIDVPSARKSFVIVATRLVLISWFFRYQRATAGSAEEATALTAADGEFTARLLRDFLLILVAARNAYKNARKNYRSRQSSAAMRATGVAVVVGAEAGAGVSGLSAGAFERHYRRSLLEVLADLATSSRRLVSYFCAVAPVVHH